MSIPDAWSQEIAAVEQAIVGLRALSDECHGVLSDLGWYDMPVNTDPFIRREVAVSYRFRGMPRERLQELERHIRHADLLEKWPAEDWWRGA